MRCLPVLLALVLALPAAAETVTFDMSLRGVTGGRIVLQADEAGGRYAVAGAAGGTGLVGRLVRKTYEGRARGTLGADGPRPASYEEVELERGARTAAEVEFAGGRPVAVRVEPAPEPAPWRLDPGEAGAAADPLSVLWWLLRPQPAARACSGSFRIFDGQRLSRLALGDRQEAEGAILCEASYERLAGYPPERMAETDGRRFTIRYEPAGEGRVAATELRAPTSLGDAVLRRR